MSKKRLFTKFISSENSFIHYDMDDALTYNGGGTTLFDLKGNNNSIIINSPIFINTTPKNFQFNGTNQSTISENNLIASQQISVSIWFKATRSGVFETVINSSVNGTSVGFTIQKRKSTSYWATIGTWGVDSAIVNFSTANDLWVNITLTYDNNLLKCYKNGFLIGSIAYLPGKRYLSVNKIIIGKGAVGATGLGEFFQGNIGDTEIWNLSLTSDKVLLYFNNKKTKYGL